ncbi:MAG: hypothetical protein RI563_03810 [Thiohalophilus sp.]|uniref:hypothetical protein n=1 Tax=Thiohalophilus sp. TaxID=3028392 RepID=UPI00287073EE|nr:hypothetical protein [Thiohalophilus sp.]MDR9435976.1 hypothetical protein [Thiohalophilus sp.]
MTIFVSRLLNRFNPPTRAVGLQRLLEPLAVRQPLVYRALVTLVALAGYLLLLLFPLIALGLLGDLSRQWQIASTWQEWLWSGLDLLIILFALALSSPLLFNRFALPRGLEVHRQNAPKLFQLVEQLRQDFKYPVLDQIILRDGFGVEVIRTPRLGLPLLYQHTLVIGLDSLLTLPPTHFKSALARRIGQLSGIHNRHVGWLASLCQTWQHYHQAFKQQRSPLARPLQWLFAIYAPFYTALAFYAVRQNELEADRYALDIANDDEIASLFSQLIVTETFLKNRFWPKITQLARRESQPEHRPYASMVQVLRRGLNREEMQQWIKDAFDTPSDVKDPTPLLQQRLENIGHHKPASPQPIKETAADTFLDPTVKQKIVDKFDQRWLAKLKHQSHTSG